MRDGTVRLLSACHEEAQALEASKNLHTINSRILALMGLLQRHRAKSVNKRVRHRESRFVYMYQRAKCNVLFGLLYKSKDIIRMTVQWNISTLMAVCRGSDVFLNQYFHLVTSLPGKVLLLCSAMSMPSYMYMPLHSHTKSALITFIKRNILFLLLLQFM